MKMPPKSASKQTASKNPSQKCKITCKQCNIVLSSEKYYQRHARTRHRSNQINFTCDFDGKQFKLKSCLKAHMERHQTSDFMTCEVCQRSYVCKITFQRHLRTHIEKFACNLCESVFKNKSMLDRHKISAHDIVKTQYACKFCTRIFPSSQLRNNHHYLSHKNNKLNLFRCHECNIDFEMKEELRIHSFIHFDKNIHTCPECHQIFKKKTLLAVHMQKHDGKKFICEVCGDTFVYKTGLEKHVRLNRCKGPINKISDEMDEKEIEEIARNQLNAVLNKCQEIEMPQDNQVSMQKENDKLQIMEFELDAASSISDAPDNDIIEEFKPRPLRSKPTKNYSKRRQPNISYICDYCGITVKYYNAMQKHIKSHIRDSKNYSCDQCSEIFNSRKKLKEHYLMAHKLKVESITARYVCEFDGRTFDTLCFYKAHMLSHSEQNRNYNCSQCPAAFKTAGNLTRHENAHAKTRDFGCSMCPKSFKTELALKIHKETVHVDTKIFVKCEICAKILQEKNLKLHMKNQHSDNQQVTRFQCVVCEQNFKSEYVARRHYKTFHGEHSQAAKLTCHDCPNLKFFSSQELREHSFIHFTGHIFECDECGKKFKKRSCLTAHKKSHIIDETFMCSICVSATFKTRSGLRKHNKNCHGS